MSISQRPLPGFSLSFGAKLAAVKSERIVRVYEAGEHEGWLFLATEIYPEGDLADRLRRDGPLSVSDTIQVLADVAEGLGDAHSAGVIHRDIKPSNVLLRHDRDGRLRAAICDFGISTVRDQEHTMTNGVIGTVGYLAPERHQGHPATVASDIYGLGCLLWACITGAAPWTGTDVQVAIAHIQEPVPQLAQAPRWLNALLEMSMAKDPEHRFRSANAFRVALLSGSADAPVNIDDTQISPGWDTTPVGDTIIRPSTVETTASIRPAPAPIPVVKRNSGLAPALGVASLVVLALIAGLVTWRVLSHKPDEPTAKPPVSQTESPEPTTTQPTPSTAEPEPSQTTAEAAVEEGRLDIAMTYDNVACEPGRYIVMVTTVHAERLYESVLSRVARDVPNARYLRGDLACEVFLDADPRTGEHIYNACVGPFDSREAACRALDSVPVEWAWVRELKNPSKQRWGCFCLPSADLRENGAPGVHTTHLVDRRGCIVRRGERLQLGYWEKSRTFGNWGGEFADALASYQADVRLDATGMLDTATWQALTADYCPATNFLRKG